MHRDKSDSMKSFARLHDRPNGLSDSEQSHQLDQGRKRTYCDFEEHDEEDLAVEDLKLSSADSREP